MASGTLVAVKCRAVKPVNKVEILPVLSQTPETKVGITLSSTG
jgi:hypothetical protein